MNRWYFRFLTRSVVALSLILCLSGCVTTRVPADLRVLTYNIHHGAGMDGRLDLERIARVIKSVDPDLVAIQEVDERTTRVGGLDEPAELGRLTGLHFVFGKAMDYQGGAYGQVILSRFPIRRAETCFLPQETNREPRILLRAEVELERKTVIHFGTTHLDHQRDDIRVEQAKEINRVFSRIRGPSIIAGDFNAYPESAPMQIILKDWADAARDNPQPTVPVKKPARRIDYILFRPADGWSAMESFVLGESVASDHRAVFARLRKQD